MSESHNDVAHVISSVHALTCATKRAVHAAAEDQALAQAQAASASASASASTRPPLLPAPAPAPAPTACASIRASVGRLP